MKFRLLLFFNVIVLTLFISTGTFAQEGTKQLMPNPTDRLYLLINPNGYTNFAEYGCTPRERLYIHLKAGEKLYLGMQFDDPTDCYFRLRDPNDNIVIDETPVPTSGQTGYIDNYDEAVHVPNGVKVNGDIQTNGFDAIVYTAQTSGDYYIEFKTPDTRYIKLFNVTVTDGDDNLVTNPDNPNTSAGRLWSYQWQMTNTSYTQYPVQTPFYIYTTGGFVDKVIYKMKPYHFVFVSNSYGCRNTGDIVRDRQSFNGNAFQLNNISEYKIFLDDPDQSVFPSIKIDPPVVKAWFNDVLIYDYDYTRDPKLLNLNVGTIDIHANKPSCSPDSTNVVYFKIQTNVPGRTAILIDVNGDGFKTGTADTALIYNVSVGTNYIPWNLHDAYGNPVTSAQLQIVPKFLEVGPLHLPIFDVEALSGVEASTVRPFKILKQTVYWDDLALPAGEWGDDNGAMDQTDTIQLYPDKNIPRIWTYYNDNGGHQNGNDNTMNTWFNSIDLGSSNLDFKLVLDQCVNENYPFVSDIEKFGPVNQQIIFTQTDFDEKFSDANNGHIVKIKILSLPTNGTLALNGAPINAGDEILYADLDKITFTPDNNWFGKTSFQWNAYNGVHYSQNPANVNITINTPPTISSIPDQNICVNSSTGDINFTVNDAPGETDPDDLTVRAVSNNPSLVDVSNITLGGSGTDRTIKITPKSDQSGSALISVFVNDGFNETKTDFYVNVGPSLDYTGSTNICPGSELRLEAVQAGADSYQWTFNGNTVSTDQVLSITNFDQTQDTGVYTLTVTKGACTGSRDIHVGLHHSVDFIGDTVVCDGGTLSLQAVESGAIYTWYKGTNVIGSSRTLTIDPFSSSDAADDYALEVTKDDCTIRSKDFSITTINCTPPKVDLAVDPSTIDENGGQATITAKLTNQWFYDTKVALAFSGSATKDVDYSVASDTIVVPAGQTSASTTLTSYYDGFHEGDEQVVVDIDKVDDGGNGAEEDGTQQQTITIKDQEPAPAVTLTTSATTVNENGGSFDVTVSLSNKTYEDVVVDLGYSGTADASDYNNALTSVTIPQGQTSVTFTITTNNDDINKGDRDIVIDVTNVTGGDAFESGTQQQTVTIIDDDKPTVTLSASPTSLTEGDAVTFTLTLSNATYEDVQVGLTYSGTATYGTDYDAAQKTVTIPQGQTQYSFTVNTTDDDIHEPAETMIVDISSVSGGDATEDGTQQQTVTINDNDPAPTVTLSTDNTTIPENNGQANITATLSQKTFEDVTINLSFSGTASRTDDYNCTDKITIPAGSLSASIQLTTIDDDIYEGDETANVSIASVNGGDATEEGTQQVDITITDDDPQPQVTLSASPTTITEGETSTITATLTNPANQDITVNLSYAGSASSDDYTAPEKIIISAGQKSASANLQAVDDNTHELQEDVQISVASITGPATDNSTTQTVTINDNDAAPTVSIAIDSSAIHENAGPAHVILSLDRPTYEDVTVTLTTGGTATEGTNYNIGTKTITIPAGQIMAQTTITPIDDNVYNGDHTVIADIDQVSGGDATENGTQQATLNIIDDDLPYVYLTTSAKEISENGGSCDITVHLTNATNEDVTVDLVYSGTATSGSDYQALPAQVTIPQGQLTYTFTLNAIDDDYYEGDETVVIDINQVSGGHAAEQGQQRDTVIITDDENKPDVGLSVENNVTDIYENSGQGPTSTKFIVTLSQTADYDITVYLSFAGSASPSDYTLSGTEITIPAHSTSGSITITAVDDDIHELDETVTATIDSVGGDGAVVGTPDNQTVTIHDDDNPPLVYISSAPTSVNESDGSYQVVFKLTNPTYQDVDVTLDYSGTASAPDDYSQVPSFTIPAETTEYTATIDVVDDDMHEPDEDVTVKIAQVNGGDASIDNSNDTKTTTIIDNDPAPQITLVIDPRSIDEQNGSATLQILLSNPTYQDVTADINLSGSAVNGTDYNIGKTSFTIPSGSTSDQTTITPIDDNTYKPDRDVIAEINSFSGGDAVQGDPIKDTVTIVDNDIPYLSISASPTSISENGGTSTITLSLSNPTYQDVNIQLQTSGDATDGTDYSIDNKNLTIPAGNTSATATLTGIDDDVYEGDEQAIVLIGSANGGNVHIDNTQDQTTVTITDDEPAPKVSLALSQTSVDESAGSVQLTASIDQKADEDVTVLLTYTGTATKGTDYTASTTMTIPAGQTQVSQDINIIDDDMHEPDETVNIHISSISGADATENGNQDKTLTILDNDNAPTVTLTADPLTIDEGQQSTLTVNLTNPTYQDVTVTLAYSGTASSSDYTAETSVTIPSGSTQGQITLTAVDDNIHENSETVIADIDQVNGGDATEDGTQQQTITINDNDAAPVVSLSIDPTSIEETNQSATVTVSLNRPTFEDVTVDLSTSGSAVEGTNYNIASKTLTIPAGSTSATTTITSIDDNVYNGDKDVVVDITSVSGGDATENGTQSQTLKIIDDDIPQVTLSVDPSQINENGGQSTVTISLSNATYEDVTVDLGFSGEAQKDDDYTVSATSVTIPQGQTSATITITAKDDNVYEGNEDIIIDITNVTGGAAVESGTQQQTVTILEDEPAPKVSLSVSATSVWEYESPVTMTVSIDQVADEDVTVYFAYSGTAEQGSDYNAPASVTIPAGQTSVQADIQIINDTVHELNEDLVIDISSITGADATEDGDQSKTVEIKDDDGNPYVRLLASTNSINEDGGSYTLTAVLQRPTYEDVTVNLSYSGTATKGVDYTAPNSIVVPAGDTSAKVQVNIVDDDMYELDENITVDISSVSGGNAYEDGTQQQTTTIVDNDNKPTISLDANPSTISENGGSGDFVVSLTNPTYEDLTVDLSLSGTAQQSTDYNISGTQITIPSGSTSGKVTVSSIDNSYYQGNRSVIATISQVTSTETYTITKDKDSIIIQDDEQPPLVSLDVSPSSIQETGGSATITVSIPDPVNYDINVDLGFSGTATYGTDYTVGNTSLTIASGKTSAQTTIDAVGDVDHEPDESVIVDILDVTGGVAAENGEQRDSTIILDDDATPSVSLSGSPTTISENGGQSTLTLTLSNTTYEDVMIVLSYSRGTAVEGKDFTAPDTVIIPAGQQSASFTLTALEDDIYEIQEQAIVDVEKVIGGDAAETEEQTLTIRINDDDNPPQVTLKAVPDSVIEGETSKIIAILTNPTYQDVTVSLGFGLTAELNSDYTCADKIIIPAEKLADTIDLTSLQDLVHEPTELAQVSITNLDGGNATIGEPSKDTVYILDTTKVYVTLQIDKDTVNENDGEATATIALSRPTYEDVTVNLNFGGNATENDDYTLSAHSVTIPQGSTTQTIAINTVDDDIFENSEDLIAQIADVSGGDAQIGSPDKDTLVILDDDTPVVSLNMTPDTVDEGNDFNVSLSYTKTCPGGITAYLSLDGTADSANDYSKILTTVHFDGSNTQTITTYDDNIHEGLENVVVLIDSVQGCSAIVSSQNRDTTFIRDNDPAPSVSIAADPTQISEGDTGQFIVSLSSLTDQDVTVSIELSGTAEIGNDYTANNETNTTVDVTIPAGQDKGYINIAAIDDNFYENTENVTAQITGVDGGDATIGNPQTASIDILDNDPVLVRLNVTPDTINELGGKANINLTLTAIPNEDVNITLGYKGTATLDEDYTAATTVTIPAGQTSLDTPLAAIDDYVYEQNESAIVYIDNVSGSDAQTDGLQQDTVIIIDDDLVEVNLNATPDSITEGDTAFVEISLSKPAHVDVNVKLNYSGTATYGKDYNSPIEILIPAGTQRIDTILTSIDDDIRENTEVAYISIDELDYNSGYEKVIKGSKQNDSVFILDNDPAEIYANPDYYVIDEDNTLKENVFVNDDTVNVYTNLIFSVETDVKHGTVSLANDGSFTYVPEHDYNGLDSFIYKVCNADESVCDTALVLITILPVNDTPVAVNDTFYYNGNTPIYGDVSKNDYLGDTPSDFTLVSDPTQGTVVLNSDGTFTYTPNSDFAGKDRYRYRLCDNNNDCVEADVVILTPKVNLSIPEGFSPNGDGTNDYFVIDSLYLYPNNHIIIFNRWGNKVFEAAPYKNNWDGTNMFGLTPKRGKLPEGTYFYILELGNGRKPIKGYIYLKR